LFWDVGGGFIDGEKSGDGDLFCFPPQKTQKKIVLKKCTASRGIRCGSYERFSFSNIEYYWITMPDGKPVRIKNAL
jgi:hypothetical protein